MKSLIVANWKMNPQSLAEAKRLFNSVKNGLRNIENVEVIICPPFPYLSSFKIQASSLELGGQDCFWEESGAFTGEVSPKMLKDLGCDYVILGHSERRKYLKETDEMINKKIKVAFKSDLTPILCIENISQLKKGTKDLLRVKEDKSSSSPFTAARVKEQKKLIIAYEPVFAIGTGKPCTPEKAKEMKTAIKKIIDEDISIIYGGSVNSQNAADCIKMAGFQGLLVGGASLDSEEFIKIVRSISSSR